MAFTATITSVTLERTNIKIVVDFTQGATTLNKTFLYDVKDEDLTAQRILDQIVAYKTLLTEKSALFQALKAREGSTV